MQTETTRPRNGIHVAYGWGLKIYVNRGHLVVQALRRHRLHRPDRRAVHELQHRRGHRLQIERRQMEQVDVVLREHAPVVRPFTAQIDHGRDLVVAHQLSERRELLSELPEADKERLLTLMQPDEAAVYDHLVDLAEARKRLGGK